MVLYSTDNTHIILNIYKINYLFKIEEEIGNLIEIIFGN